MSAAGESSRTRSPRACSACLRRGWLLSELGACIDYSCRDQTRLSTLLALEDEELLRALGGRRRAELGARHAQFDPKQLRRTAEIDAVCRHDRSYPRALTGAWSPWALHVAGGVQRLAELTAAPVVAIVGSTRATDYGVEMAKSLARGLSAAGVTVTSGLTDGIAVAAHLGTLEARGRSLAVMPGGLDVACPAKRRSLYACLRLRGCAVAELPCGCPGRRWGPAASVRVIAGLAQLTVVVEAADSPAELAGARIARTLGRTVAAVPGRVTSPASRGTHTLLMDGAQLVRDAADVLALLQGGVEPGGEGAARAPASLEPRLRHTLESVGGGRDTPDRLAAAGTDAGEVLLRLSELELAGLVARGDGGRYVLRDALPSR